MKLKQPLIVLTAAAITGCAYAAVNQIEIEENNRYRYIESNGIPDHSHGNFPNRGNPNAISAQNHRFRMPANPVKAGNITQLRLQPFGVALNGIPFDPGAAEFWRNDRSSGWQYEAMSGAIPLGIDFNNAHVQPSGAYHYHGIPTGLVDKLSTNNQMTLIGYAADGFPIYSQYGYRKPMDSTSGLRKLSSSYQLKQGQRPSGNRGPGGRYDGTFVQDYVYRAGSGDLDQCNGRTGVTPEYPNGIYHYFLSDQYPFIPRCFVGTPDSSFAKKRGPGPGQGQPRHRHRGSERPHHH